MAPIKFEENIKQRLENRTIEPSSDAWNRLSKRLDDQDENSNNKMIWWIGIAASFIGVFLVVTFFVNTNEQEPIIPKIVETPVEDNIIVPGDNSESIIDKNSLNQPSLSEKIAKDEVNESVVKPSNNRIEKSYESKQERTDLASNKKSQNSIELDKKVHGLNENSDVAVQEKVADLEINEKEVNIIEDSEINLLLNQAQQDIALRKIENDKKLTIDSNALLEDVEADLDQSFREKIFETIITSYNSVRTAVVQRND